ncbi:hypothetical protein [Corynebacterium aquilae]|uniref:Lipoprotein n=1 Tax=Corynebacterium aquilae DSM 44791 TaxID=1431546 RepID=A0A1L7CIP7_9CORY|nr:hypothetical protein [Corynebacterium aquilae]APT85653.1 hypothetical protein CAQU_12065 [Corynebacterium aquilae DSM 44791]
MNKAIVASIATLVSLSSLGGCHGEPEHVDAIGKLVRAGAPFTLNDVYPGVVAKGYFFCQYSDPSEAAPYGFSKAQFYTADNDVHMWETATAVGVTFNDGSAPIIEWFPASEVDACDDTNNRGKTIEPDQVITITQVNKDLGPQGTRMVPTLRLT